MIHITATPKSYPIRGGFAIARGRIDHVSVIEVKIYYKNMIGLGECRPYPRYGETPESVIEQIKSVIPIIEPLLGNPWHAKDILQNILPACAARNALDCALWDLICKYEQKDIFTLLTIPPQKTLTSLFTISVDTPQKMAEKSCEAVKQGAEFLKIKLAGQEDEERLLAVYHAVPQNIKLMLDANEAWDKEIYMALYPILQDIHICFIEQPFPVSQDDILNTIPRSIPIFADESFHILHDVDKIKSKYDGVNIKLDKTGGLTDALLTVKALREYNMQWMMGCMMASSLGMAPAFILSCMGAYIADLDAPALLEADCPNPMLYDKGKIYAPTSALWGGAGL